MGWRRPANTLSSGNIINFKATLDPATDNITVINNKTISNGKVNIFTTLADQTKSSTNRTLRFNATGNGTGGIEIMLILNKIN